MEATILGPTSAIGNLVSRAPVRVPVSATLQEAACVMREANVASALVGEGAAIATERDLTTALADGLSPGDPITAVMTVNPVRTSASTTVLDAAALMLNQEIRHLVIDRSDGSAWVVSLREVMAVLLQSAAPHLWLTSLRLAVESHPESWLG
jgi:CBS domain-containing protein